MSSGRRALAGLVALLLAPWLDARAASRSEERVEPAERTLATSLGMAVYPSRAPGTPQQLKDEGECYAWAKARTGVDPLGLQQERGDPALAEEDTRLRREIALGAGRSAFVGSDTGHLGRGVVGRGGLLAANVGTLLGEARQQGLKKEEELEMREARGPSEARDTFEREFGGCLAERHYVVKSHGERAAHSGPSFLPAR